MTAVKTTGVNMKIEVVSTPSWWRGRYTREQKTLDLTGRTLYGVVFEQDDNGKLKVGVVYCEDGTHSDPVELPSIKMDDIEQLSIVFI